MLGDYNPLIELTTKKDYKDCFKLYQKFTRNNIAILIIIIIIWGYRYLYVCYLQNFWLLSDIYTTYYTSICEEGEFDRL